MSKLKVVTKLSQIRTLIGYIKETRYCSFDFETSGLKYYHEDEFLTCMAISFQPGSAWAIPLDHKDSKFKGKTKKILKMFKEEVFENYHIVKVAHNFKFEYKWLMRYGIHCKGVLLDSMLAKYLLEEQRPMGLKELVARLYPQYAGYEDKLGKGNWANKPLIPLMTYCGIDTDMTLRIMIYLERKLMKLGFYSLFRNLNMMLTRVLGESEYRGMHIDSDYLKSLIKKYSTKIAKVEKKLYSLKSVKKFEKAKKQEINQLMIDTLKQEIKDIKKNKPNPDVMVRNREEKISKIVAGGFTGKAGKTKAYEGFNFQSPPQLAELFFTHKAGMRKKVIRYTVNKKTKQESTNPSTDESVLLELQPKDKTGIIDALLEHRGLSKLFSTYIQGMYEHMDKQTHLIHGTFLIHGTVTGRLSSKEPNLQNIPRVTTNPDIKKMFIPPPGYVMLEVDYAQAELRVFAELAEDEAMIEIFNNNYNIHVATACMMNGGLDQYDIVKGIIKDEHHPDNLFWEKAKKKAKTINFGILYEQGPDKLAEGLGCTPEEARQFKKEWLNSYPQGEEWIERQHQFVKKHGYVTNLFGRKRRLPEAMYQNGWQARQANMFGKWLEAQRQSVNAPIQGTSSDFTTFSQVMFRDRQRRGDFPKDMKQCYTVHDSIGFYIRPEHLHWVVPKLIELCDNPQTQKFFGFSLKHVKMKVSAELGDSWANYKDYDPWEDYTKLITT